MFNLEWSFIPDNAPTPYAGKIRVWLKGDPLMNVMGKSLDEAVGNWIRTHGHKLDVKVEQRS